jgi:multidrug transporter EmrE-like cation transporter
MLALGAYSFALSRLDLSIAYPIMTSLGLVIVALASILLFGETFNGPKIAGTLLIIFGVILLTYSS